MKKSNPVATISVKPHNISANRFNSINIFPSVIISENNAPIIDFQRSLKTLLKTASHLNAHQDFSTSPDEEALRKNLSINLMLIGVISAVETYCRSIIREILCLEHNCFRQKAYSANLSYGAALSNNKNILPEALLEHCSLANSKNISDTFKDILGLVISPQRCATLHDALEAFEKVCHIRHCIVHRSGKLGSSNAIKFGYTQHLNYIEQQMVIDLQSLEDMCNICENVVLELNDVLLNHVLSQIVALEEWSGDLRKDKRTFNKYLKIFLDPTLCPKDIKSLYKEFKTKFAI